MTTTGRKALEAYFIAKKELREKRDAGALDNLHYQIEDRRIDGILAEQSHLAASAVIGAIKLLGDTLATRLSSANACRVSELLTWDHAGYKAWHKQYFDQNMEAATLRLLELRESVEVPPIPDPAPPTVKKETKSSYLQRADGLPTFNIAPKARGKSTRQPSVCETTDAHDFEGVARAEPPPGTEI